MQSVLFCPHAFNGGFLLNPIPHLSRQPILPGTEQPTLLKRGRLKDKIKRQLIPPCTARVAALCSARDQAPPAAAVAGSGSPKRSAFSSLAGNLRQLPQCTSTERFPFAIFASPRKKKAVRNVQALYRVASS